MKSLRILVLLSTLSILLIGTIVIASPALALEQGVDQGTGAIGVVPEISSQSFSPATGAKVDESVQAQAFQRSDLAVAVSAEAVTFTFEKDAALASFITSVSNGTASRVTGIYVEEVLALAVGGQGGNAGYVTTNPNEATQFAMAADYGSKAFLAHNTLAGAAFFNVSQGQMITLVYGDGRTEDYQIQAILSFQALQPNSPYSNFVDLDSGAKLSAAELFYSIYNSDHPVVLQTCIENEGISTWGRLFVVAVPVS